MKVLVPAYAMDHEIITYEVYPCTDATLFSVAINICHASQTYVSIYIWYVYRLMLRLEACLLHDLLNLVLLVLLLRRVPHHPTNPDLKLWRGRLKLNALPKLKPCLR